jgi:hypothetical protein
MDTQDNASNKISAIDRALAAAKARKAANKAQGGEDSPKEAGPTPDKAAAKAAREAERAQKAELRAAEAQKRAEDRAARKAAKAAASGAERPTAHMKKVERARSKCLPLGSEAERVYGDVTANLSAGQITALAQHLLVHVRATQTLRALKATQAPVGSVVRITGGDPRYIGAVGTVVHSQKLRTAVQIAGVRRPVYIYTGESEPAESKAAAVG